MAFVRKSSAYEPVVKLKDMLLASDRPPVFTTTVAAPGYEIFTVGVPVTVMLVTIGVDQSVPPVVLAQVMLPVPKAMVRTFVLEDVNDSQVNV